MGRFESPPNRPSGENKGRSQAERQAERQAKQQQQGSPVLLRLLIVVIVAILGFMAYLVLKDEKPGAPEKNYIRNDTYVAGVNVSGLPRDC